MASQTTLVPEHELRLPYGKIYTSYFAAEARAHRRLPENRFFIAPVRLFPTWANRGRYRYLKHLAPSVRLFSQRRFLDFETYEELYIDQITHEEDALQLLGSLVHDVVEKKINLVIFCYEKTPERCHRSSLKKVLVNLCALHTGQQPVVFDGGEIR